MPSVSQAPRVNTFCYDRQADVCRGCHCGENRCVRLKPGMREAERRGSPIRWWAKGHSTSCSCRAFSPTSTFSGKIRVMADLSSAMDALGLLNVRVRGIHQGDDTVLYIAALNRPLANDGSGSIPGIGPSPATTGQTRTFDVQECFPDCGHSARVALRCVLRADRWREAALECCLGRRGGRDRPLSSSV